MNWYSYISPLLRSVDEWILTNLSLISFSLIDFVPYLYSRPFTILDTCLDSESTLHDFKGEFASTESTITSLTIIFNLALSYHINDHASPKASSLYEIALALLLTLPLPTDSQSFLLHAAVLNNYGVWCYQNREYPTMTTCFEEIEHINDETTWSSYEDINLTQNDSAKHGILRNLRVFLSDSSHHLIL